MTTPENQNTTQEHEPFFPPAVLLAVSGAGLLLALAVRVTQQHFNIVGWGGLLVGIIAFIAWLVMNPQAVKDFLQGRGLAFGGMAVIISIVMVIAAVLVYMVVAAQSWSIDFTEGQQVSLADNTRKVVTTLGDDPTTGSVRFVAFFTATAAANRDRLELLLKDFEATSNGKITYQFIDPDREPLQAQAYGDNIRSGQVAVTLLDPGTGEPLAADAQLLTNPDQYQLTNTLIQVLAAGDFRAYMLDVENGVDMTSTADDGGNDLVTLLRDRFRWTVQIINPITLTLDTPAVTLGDTAADGDIVIIPGGTAALPDDVVTALSDYIANGGDMVLMGGINLTAEPTLASADNMTALLQEQFGVRVRNDIVIDPDNVRTQGLDQIYNNWGDHPIVSSFTSDPNVLAVFSLPQSIEIADTLPENVEVTVLLSTSPNAYAKQGVDLSGQLSQTELQARLQQTADDPTGAIPVAVAAENTVTGARLVVFGSDSMAFNAYNNAGFGIVNQAMTQQAIFWASNFDDFAASLASVSPVEQKQPDEVRVDVSDVGYIQFVTVLLIPFGSLILGVAVWWVQRERNHA